MTADASLSQDFPPRPKAKVHDGSSLPQFNQSWLLYSNTQRTKRAWDNNTTLKHQTQTDWNPVLCLEFTSKNMQVAVPVVKSKGERGRTPPPHICEHKAAMLLFILPLFPPA